MDFNTNAKSLLSFLDKSEIQPINQEYKVLKKRKNGQPNWYALFGGPENLNSLSQTVDEMINDDSSENIYEMEILYHLIYKPGSRTVHGSGTMANIARHEDKDMGIMPGIRNPQDINNEGYHTAQLLLIVYNTCINSISKQYKSELDQWYKDEISRELQRIIQVRLNVDWQNED